MQRYRFPIAVATTSLALVLILVGGFGLLAGNALAMSPLGGGGPPWAGQGGGWGPGGWHGNPDMKAKLPPELAGLADIPAGERFAHFRGVQVQLTDKNNQPLGLSAIPGTATNVTPTSLTLAANDGSSRTFTINDKTVVHGRAAGVSQNDQVVVLALNGGATASGVVIVNK